MCKASGRTCSQAVSGRLEDFKANVIACQMMLLYCLHCPFPRGLYLLVLLVAIPFVCKYCLTSSERKSGALSLCIKPGIPKMEKSWLKHLITVLLSMFLQGKANGNLEYSSTRVSMYLLPVADDGSGPLKSMFIC